MRVIEIEARCRTSDHAHYRERRVFMLKGEGRVIVEGETRAVAPGENQTLRNDSGETTVFVRMIPGSAARARTGAFSRL